jgi:hypothetical protein
MTRFAWLVGGAIVFEVLMLFLVWAEHGIVLRPL